MDEQVKKLLQARIYPLGKAEDNGKFDDLAFLPEVLKGNRILALGESTHGTREHFQFKHRIFRYLAENYGYRTIMFEASLDACDLVNEYVLHGEGTKEKVLAGLHFWTWDTEEVSAMIDWMRIHNRSCSPEKKVSFLGCDCQSCDVACQRLREILLPYAGKDQNRINRLLYSCENADIMNSSLDQGETEWLLNWLVRNRTSLIKKLDENSYQQINRYARHLYQFSTLFGDLEHQQDTRDGWMAENVSFQLESMPEDEHLVLWAHNAHICGKHPKYRNLGERLSERYGKEYYALGFSFGEGSFQARLITPDPSSQWGVKIGGLREFPVPKSDEEEWDHDFSELNSGNYFLDLRSAVTEPAVLKWAQQEKYHRIIGSGFQEIPKKESFRFKGQLDGFFSGVLYTQKTSRARPTPTGIR